MDEVPSSKSDFRSRLSSLQTDRARSSENPGSYEVDNCVRCRECMFTSDSEDCVKCTDCNSCVECTACTHCTDCESCFACNHCIDCTGCAESSHLVMSTDCYDCTFCFGCVGLVGREFCILNEQYTREEYFKRAEELEKMFRL